MNDLLIRAFVKKIKSENMNSDFKTKPGFVEKRMKQFTDRLEQLKTELKDWEDMIPVNNMGKLARQTKIDNLKSEIESMIEDIGPDYDSAGFTEDDRIVDNQYRVISNEDADEDFRYSQMNVKTENK